MNSNSTTNLPPPELVQQLYGLPQMRAIEKAYQAGADQELEACCEWVEKTIPSWAPNTLNEQLRAARRPKPPSLKEQALEMLESAWEGGHINNNAAQVIRRALEALSDD
jgi:hypothetical protein